MNILITSIGKRVQLINHLKKTFKIIGVDSGDLVAGSFFVDKFYKAPTFDDCNYINVLVNICKEEEVKLLIPLYEREFNILCDKREIFDSIGVKLLLSSKEIINICNDKLLTSKFFKENKISAPKDYSKEEINEFINDNKLPLNLIIKPRDGMGSQGIHKINNVEELDFYYRYVKNPIVQEFIEGEEYTIDILCDFKGNPIYIIPRRRIEVRSGEVTKSKIVIDMNIIKRTKYLIEKLNNYKNSCIIGIQGPLTVQCFRKKNGDIVFLEINPRFGGGVPLSFEAGADYGFCLKKLLIGESIEYFNIKLKELTMVRFDEAFYIR